ncbi:MAG TPA: ABC transporter permease [Anaerolineae bacterium]|nr:ABC transporter permease [Anaerolineae bacterium]
MILRNLLRRRTRTLLTLVGVSLGVAAIVSLVAVANGLIGGYAALWSGAGVDLTVAQAEALDPSTSVIDQGLGEELLKVAGVKAVAGMIYGEATTDQIPYLLIFGNEPEGFAIEHFKIVEGEGLTSRSRREIIIGKLASDTLNRGVGDSIRMHDSAYRIVGIYETGQGLEEGGGVVTLEDAQAMLKRPRQVNVFLVQLKELADADEARERMERRFPDLAVTKSGENATQETMMGMISAFAWGISLLAVIIGGVGMMNTVLMSIFERTREIGLLRALGWRKSRVLRMILMESIGLSLIGGVLGSALGIVTVWLFGRIPATAGLMQGKFSVSLFIQAFIVALGLGAIGGLYPAWRASQLDPLLAMQYDAERGGEATRRWPGGMIVRNLVRRRTRSLLTVLGIGIAVASVVALSGLSKGFGEQFNSIGRGGQVDLMAVQAGISDMQFSAIDERVAKRIAALPEVKSVSGIVFGFSSAENMPLLFVQGYQPNTDAIRHFRIVEGEALSGTRQALLGRTAADAMGVEVGESVNVLGSRFRVVGLYETGVAFEDSAMVISLREAQALFGGPRKVGFLGIALWDPRQVDSVLKELEEHFPEVSVSKTAEFADSLPDFKAMDAMIGAITFLAVLVGGIGMMNTVFMSVFERTREIGVLRALGWRKGRVLGMIMKESLLLSAVGGVVGIVLGMGLGNLFPLLLAMLEPFYSGELLVRALVLALALGAIAGLYPSWWASRLDPLEALRYE